MPSRFRCSSACQAAGRDASSAGPLAFFFRVVLTSREQDQRDLLACCRSLQRCPQLCHLGLQLGKALGLGAGVASLAAGRTPLLAADHNAHHLLPQLLEALLADAQLGTDLVHPVLTADRAQDEPGAFFGLG